MFKPGIFCVVVLLAPTVVRPESTWRPPTDAELGPEDQSWRNESARRYLSVSEDLDGDGRIDLAEIVVNTGENAFAVRVVLASDPSNPLILARESEAEAVGVMGLDSAEPGEYKTACGKGYWECQSGEPEKLKLVLPALNYFRPASANSFLVWSPTDREFARIWISD